MAACEVTLNTQECLHPPGAARGEFGPVRTTCYQCGQRACASCSIVKPVPVPVRHQMRQIIALRRRRICNDCA